VGQELDFGLLGPLMVRCDQVTVSISSGFQRSLLAVLLLNAGRVVPADALIDALWDTRPPASARASLLNCVSRLRTSLGEAGRDRLQTGPGGYLLALEPDELDVSRFEMHLTMAQHAARKSEWRQSSDQAWMALAQWRGQPLSDVASLVLARRETPRLEEMRLQALEIRLAADLHVGGHAEVIPELWRLAGTYPLRENLRALLMLALYRSGRQGEALAAYREARDLLVNELGTEPGAGLRDLHQRILAGDSGLSADGLPAIRLAESLPAAEDQASGPAAPRVPAGGVRQLPPAAPYFAGRSAELAALTDQRPDTGGAVVTVAIDGTAGVGKTTLAVQWAHQMADQFPDGQLYVNLRGYGPVDAPLDPANAIRQLLEGLGVAAERIPVALAERIGLYRRLLARQRVVIVLDNARDSDQVRPLLPGSPGCLAVVTSRRQLTGLSVADGAYLVSLDLLSEEDARELLERRLGAGRVSAETEAVSEVIRLCGYLPLSLSIVAARAAARPAQPLAAQAAKLLNAQNRLDGLSTGDVTTDLRAVFSWSYQQVSPTAARLFRLIGVHPGPDFTAAAATSLAGIPQNEARQALAELDQAHLLTEPVPGRHACHDLLQDYAGEQALVHETQETRHAAIRRLLDFYLHTTFAASRLLHPYRDLIIIDELLPPVKPEVLADRQQALEWFRAERPVLLAAIETAAREGFDRYAWQLSWTMATFLTWQGHWQELVRSQQTALAAARRLGDRAAQAAALHYVGQTQFRLGLAAAADVHQHEALELGRQLDSGIIQGRAMLELARIAAHQGHRRDAVTYAERSLPHFQAAESPSWEADALNAAAWYRSQLGDHLIALAHCERALNAQRELGNHIGEAATLDSLGYIHHQLGHYDQAVACFQEAVKVQGDTLIAEERATVLAHLGDAFHAAGEAVQASSAWHQALSILEDMGDPGADTVRRKLRRKR
jgi:DNA-binding SARP family transcriptional activator/tetratricopeptide (TPR) repeat protein